MPSLPSLSAAFPDAPTEDNLVPPDVPSLPCFPSIQVFGAPKPPKAVANATKVMPGLAAWEDVLNYGEEDTKDIIMADYSMAPLDPRLHVKLAWPVHGQVSSPFGPRGSGARVRMHQGIDIPVPKGTPVQAALGGLVLEAKVYNGYGETVILQHENGIYTLYAHCSELLVKPGETVKAGQVIAAAGSTGRSTTSHVHFGVVLAGAFRDPMTLLKQTSDQFAQKGKNTPF